MSRSFALHDPDALGMIGRFIGGRYDVRAIVSAGSSATVYDGTDCRTGRRVAVKVFHSTWRSAEGRVATECRASGIEHPNVCVPFDVGDVDGVPFLVLERLFGETLADRISAAPTSLLYVCDVFAQLLSALDAVHRAGIIHCDVKPSNVFLTRAAGCATIVRLLDFGCAREVGSDSLEPTPRVTGTPAYMAPEQARGAANVDGRADLYATAVTLFEALTGRRPYKAANYGSLLSVRDCDVPDVRDIRRDTPDCLAAVLRRGMARDRRERFASAREMQRALAEARSELRSSSERPTSPLERSRLERGNETRVHVYRGLSRGAWAANGIAP